MREAEAAWYTAVCCSALSVGISAVLIHTHLQHFTKPVVQSKIVGILWMVPIYAVDSCLSLRFKDAAMYLNLLRDCYEGYALYLFLALLVGYLGDGNEYKVIEILEGCPPRNHSFPFVLFTAEKTLPHGKAFLRWCKFGTLQYSVVKPMASFVAIVLHPLGLYTEGSVDPRDSWIWITLIVNTSVCFAFYALGCFYVMLKEPLEPFAPVPKFLCIKAVLFLSYWQSMVIALLAKFDLIHAMGTWTQENVQTGVQDLLICIEMMCVAIAHTTAFTAQPYIGGIRQTSADWLEKNFAHESVVRDFNEVMPVLLPSNFTPGPARTTVRIPLGEQHEQMRQEQQRRRQQQLQQQRGGSSSGGGQNGHGRHSAGHGGVSKNKSKRSSGGHDSDGGGGGGGGDSGGDGGALSPLLAITNIQTNFGGDGDGRGLDGLKVSLLGGNDRNNHSRGSGGGGGGGGGGNSSIYSDEENP